ncbi:MAG TPA: hypothetical protein VG778_03970, partial [Blastocatellia bacterium]|nr:hypothetical protein [Blastocatellia bacterium]
SGLGDLTVAEGDAALEWIKMTAWAKEESANTDQIEGQEISQALDRILSSRHFVHAPKKQKFLKLVCDFYLSGRASELNEYLIGREVFDRDDTYNPAADPIVRVGAHEVRKKLDLYYETEGSADEIRLEIPIGSYEPIFVRTRKKLPEPQPIEQSRQTEVAPAPAVRASRIGRIATVGVILLLAAAITALWLSNRQLRQQVEELNVLRDGSAFGVVWEPFLKSEALTLLVISNPAVYRFTNPVDPSPVIKRSLGLNSEQLNVLRENLKDRFVMRQKEIPRLVLAPEDYTGMGEAIGLHRVTDLFRTTGKSLLLRQSRTASAEDLKTQNVILLGSTWVNEWSGKLPAQEDFAYTGNATIENRNPHPGEQSEYRPEFDEKTGELIVDYALVTVKPNISFEDTVMVLAGVHSEGTEAAAEFVTSKTYLNDFNLRLKQAGGTKPPPKYYQALLKVNVENGIPTTISLVTLHELVVDRE